MPKVEVEIKEIEQTSILLGHIMADFENTAFKGDIVASGNTLRIHVKDKASEETKWFDVDVEPLVQHALERMTDV